MMTYNWKRLVLGLIVALIQVIPSEAKRQNVDYLKEMSDLSKLDYPTKDYVEIDEYLAENNAAENDFEQNMKILLELLRVKRSSPEPSISSVVETLKQITSLRNIKGKCDWNGFTILYKNYLATGGAELETWPSSRIGSLVHRAAMRHSGECHSIYPSKYKVKIAKMDEQLLERVDSFTWAYLRKFLKMKERLSAKSWAKVLFENFILRTRSMDKERDGQMAYDTIKFLAKRDPNLKYFQYVIDDTKGTFELKSDKIEGLFNIYLIEPCREYLQELGPDVFGPADFDAKFSQLNSELSSDVHYYETWAKFRICSVLIEHDHERLFEQLLGVVNKSLDRKATLHLA